VQTYRHNNYAVVAISPAVPLLFCITVKAFNFPAKHELQPANNFRAWLGECLFVTSE